MATDFSIKTAIKAVDRATRPIKRVAKTVATRLTLAFRGATRAGRRLNKMTGAVIGGMARFGAAGLAAGAAGVMGLTKYINKGDELGKLSRQLGFTVESLQEWRFAADRMGVGAEVFDQSMGAFSKRLGEARVGNGALLKMLDKTGPKFKAQILGAKNSEQALQLYIAAMRKVKDPAMKASLAAAAFGRAGLKFTRFADESAEGIAELRKEKRQLGVITTEQAAASEKAADKIANFKAAVGGVVAQVAGAMLPAFIRATEALGSWIKETRIANSDKLRQVFDAIGRVVASIDFNAIANALKAVWTVIEPVLTEIYEAFRDNWEAIKQATTVVLGVVAGIFLAKWAIILNAARAVVRSFTAIWDALKKVFSGLVDFIAGVFTMDADRAIGGLRKMFDGFGDFFSALWGGVVDFFKGVVKTIGGLFDKLAPKPLKDAWRSVKGWFKELWDQITTVFDSAISAVMEYIRPLVEVIENAIRGIERISSFGGGTVSFKDAVGPIDAAAWAPATSAAAAAGVAGAARSEVNVNFRNAPPGIDVETTRSTGPGVVKTNVGRRVAGAGAML